MLLLALFTPHLCERVITFLLYYLFTFINIHPLSRGLRGELAAAEVVPSGGSRMFNVQYSMFNVNDSCGIILVAEVQAEAADRGGIIAEVHMEVVAESFDAHVTAGVVQLVAAAEVEVARSASPLGSSKNGQWSMVNGQLKKGLYIHNGNKVVIK